ncbi:hypothetical protein Ciccas_000376 [Cichlidogyrus casuarinus]|uniref:Cyclin-like domain-containing protein n=1 Tax=Cichlidogyrus casuarinus TaxID=1844966 RepID=A0ABD2QNB9_9PLAT
MDWLVQVQLYLNQRTETLHLAVMLIDRFTWLEKVENNTYQLLAITAFFVATKYIERFPPKLKALCHLTENAFKPRNVLHFEKTLLRVLDFRMDLALPCHLVPIIVQNMPNMESAEQDTLRRMGAYFLDITLSQNQLVGVPGLHRALAIVILGRICCLGNWSQADESFQLLKQRLGLESELKDAELDIKTVIKCLCSSLNQTQQYILNPKERTPPNHKGAYLKYNNQAYNGIARCEQLIQFDFEFFQSCDQLNDLVHHLCFTS